MAGWGRGARGTDGANTTGAPVGNISAKEMRELEQRAEVRSDEETADWAAKHAQSYEKRDQN